MDRLPAFLRSIYLALNYRQAMFEDLTQRSMIGRSRDSGYLLYEACRFNPALKVETVSPVYNHADGFVPPTVSPFQQQLETEALGDFHDDLSYLPRRKGFIVHDGFLERGFPDFREEGWEEFIWLDAPFAFHIRGEVHRARVGDVDELRLLDGLNAILARYGDRRVATWQAEESSRIPRFRIGRLSERDRS